MQHSDLLNRCFIQLQWLGQPTDKPVNYKCTHNMNKVHWDETGWNPAVGKTSCGPWLVSQWYVSWVAVLIAAYNMQQSSSYISIDSCISTGVQSPLRTMSSDQLWESGMCSVIVGLLCKPKCECWLDLVHFWWRLLPWSAHAAARFSHNNGSRSLCSTSWGSICLLKTLTKV